MLPDGTYDAFVVDASPASGPPDERPGLRLDLTILSGPHKGEVVSMKAVGELRDEVDLLGLPATLTVADGQPSLVIEE